MWAKIVVEEVTHPRFSALPNSKINDKTPSETPLRLQKSLLLPMLVKKVTARFSSLRLQPQFRRQAALRSSVLNLRSTVLNLRSSVLNVRSAVLNVERLTVKINAANLLGQTPSPSALFLPWSLSLPRDFRAELSSL